MISIATLIAAGIGPTQARAFEKPLAQACDQFYINTTLRLAAFVAQCAHESSLFVHLEESLLWRDPVRLDRFFSAVQGVDDARALIAAGPQATANRIYAGKDGNGSEASGDGWKYRGRGLFQLTGRGNYAKATADLREPFLDHPEYVADPADASLTAAWYWNRYRLNVIADAGDIDAITLAINGKAMAGAQERRDLYAHALMAFA